MRWPGRRKAAVDDPIVRGSPSPSPNRNQNRKHRPEAETEIVLTEPEPEIVLSEPDPESVSAGAAPGYPIPRSWRRDSGAAAATRRRDPGPDAPLAPGLTRQDQRKIDNAAGTCRIAFVGANSFHCVSQSITP